jgi:flagellar basal body-associated protein FliL
MGLWGNDFVWVNVYGAAIAASVVIKKESQNMQTGGQEPKEKKSLFWEILIVWIVVLGLVLVIFSLSFPQFIPADLRIMLGVSGTVVAVVGGIIFYLVTKPKTPKE